MQYSTSLYQKAFARYLRNGTSVFLQLKQAAEEMETLIHERWIHAPMLASSLVTDYIAYLQRQFAVHSKTWPDINPPDTEALQSQFVQTYRTMLDGIGDTADTVDLETLHTRVDRAERFLANRFRQKIAPIFQPHYGIRYFTWVGGGKNPCANCAAHKGQTYPWGSGEMPPGCANCQCAAAPSFQQNTLPDDPPIEPVYPELALLPLLRIGRLYTAWRNLVRARGARKWKLSPTKSHVKWRNQIEKGGWTPEKIQDLLLTGSRTSVKNERTGGAATLYQKEGRFLVRDDKTGDILQLSRPGFRPKTF